MFLSLFRTSTRLAVFATGLLLGIQVPAFVEQYALRVDAHYNEVTINISGFQRTADELFSGDLQALINYYRNSNDPVFERDAENIAAIAARYDRLGLEQAAMQGSMLAVVWHVVVAGDREILGETRSEYGYNVPLNSAAIMWGLALALLVMLSMDACVFCGKKCVSILHRRPNNHLHG